MKQKGCTRRDFFCGFGRLLSLQEKITDDDILQGREFFVVKNYALAAKCFQSRVETGGEECEELNIARAFWGICLYHLQRAKEALEVFAKMSAEQDRPFVYLYKALALAAENEVEAAIAELAKFTDFNRPLVMRAVNLQLGLFEEGLGISAGDLQRDILDAIDKSGDMLEWK